jgi:hypothetical protein
VGCTLGGGSYEIRLAGRLSDSVLSALECEAWGLTVSVEPADMVLYGPVQDQAALGGLVDRILSSGLEVVEVRRLPPHLTSLGRTRATAVTPVELHELTAKPTIPPPGRRLATTHVVALDTLGHGHSNKPTRACRPLTVAASS